MVEVIQTRAKYIYWDVGVSYSNTSDQYNQANLILVAFTSTWIGLCIFEWLLMIIGTSVQFNSQSSVI